jgi:hypothetical protein
MPLLLLSIKLNGPASLGLVPSSGTVPITKSLIKLARAKPRATEIAFAVIHRGLSFALANLSVELAEKKSWSFDFPTIIAHSEQKIKLSHCDH